MKIGHQVALADLIQLIPLQRPIGTVIILAVKRDVPVGFNHAWQHGFSFYRDTHRIRRHPYLSFGTDRRYHAVLKYDHASFNYRTIHGNDSSTEQGNGLLLGKCQRCGAQQEQ